MRFTACALTAVLLSGCSWLGSGGSYGDSYGYGYNGVYNGGCSQGAAGANFANAGYGYGGGAGAGGGGCAAGAGYNVASGGGMYGGGAGMGAGMYGAGAGGAGGLRGAYGVNGYGTGLQGAGAYGGGAGAYGAGAGAYGGGAGGYGAGAGAYGGGAGMYAPGGGYGAGAGLGGAAGIAGLGAGTGGYGAGYGGNGITTLGGAAPYGAAVGGMQSYGGGNVQTVQGAPIYVPQPYPAYYQAQSAGYGGGYNYGGGTLPIGLELGGGQDFFINGDFFPGEVGKPFNGGPGIVSDLAPIAYADAFDNAKGLDLTATYDMNHNTTLLGRVGYTKAGGDALKVGTVSDGLGTVEDLYAEFSDLEQYTVEGGFRHYMGRPTGMRPYIGGTAGFVKTEDVTLTQGSATLVDPTIFQQTYVDGGWSPTASGLIGAEWAMGNRSAVGVETGIRWTDDLDTNFVSDDRWSVPVRLRGRVSF